MDKLEIFNKLTKLEEYDYKLYCPTCDAFIEKEVRPPISKKWAVKYSCGSMASMELRSLYHISLACKNRRLDSLNKQNPDKFEGELDFQV